jgi:iron uptake system component EfeO
LRPASPVELDGAAGGREGETPAESGEATDETTEETTTEETTAVEVGGSPELAEAAEGYEEYVVEQAALLEERTRGFMDAVISGDVQEAKALYAPARVPWERIEPVRAQFGDYDPRIDARKGDVPRDEWQGFHTGPRRPFGSRVQRTARRSMPECSKRTLAT